MTKPQASERVLYEVMRHFGVRVMGEKWNYNRILQHHVRAVSQEIHKSTAHDMVLSVRDFAVRNAHKRLGTPYRSMKDLEHLPFITLLQKVQRGRDA